MLDFHCRINHHIKSLINQRSKEEGISENAIVTKAITLYLTKDTMDESLLIAKLTDITRKIDYLQKRIEVQEKLNLEWYQYFFLFSPELPKDPEELKVLTKKANNNVQMFLTNFRNHIKKIKPLIESLFGDMLEEEVIENPGENK